MTGGLVTPSATATTCVVPVAPGVQIVGVVTESQVPAQRFPLSATVATEGLLDSYENTSVIGLPTPFLAKAVKSWDLPNSKEIFGDGVSAIVEGMPGGTT